MFSLKILKFPYKLSNYKLPPTSKIYRIYLNKITTPYLLRPHPLPLPQTTHVYAESALIYQLIQMKNNISRNDKLILQNLMKGVIHMLALVNTLQLIC